MALSIEAFYGIDFKNPLGANHGRETPTLSTDSRLKRKAIPLIFSFLIALCLTFSPTCARSGEYQSLKEIREVAAQFLQDVVENQPGNQRVEIGAIDSRLRLSACSVPLVAFLPTSAGSRGKLTVGVRCSGSKPWKLFISARIHTYNDVVVLTRSLPRHAIITAADVRLKKHDVTDATFPLLTAVEQALGKKLTRSLPADRPLTPSMLKSPIVIRRGQRITLLYKSHGIEVRASGIALGDGGEGQPISAKPHGASVVVAGVVLKPGVILVNQD